MRSEDSDIISSPKAPRSNNSPDLTGCSRIVPTSVREPCTEHSIHVGIDERILEPMYPRDPQSRLKPKGRICGEVTSTNHMRDGSVCMPVHVKKSPAVKVDSHCWLNLVSLLESLLNRLILLKV